MLLGKPGMFVFYKYGLNKTAQQAQEQTGIPMDIIMDQISTKLNSKNDSKIYLLRAGVGSGKSSFFVDSLLKASNGMKMYCTKPRVALVKEAMTDLPPHYPGLIQGLTMGYKVGGGDQIIPTFPQSVLFMTTQILTNMIIMDTGPNSKNDLFSSKFCIIDEVHEVSEQMIQVLYFIKYYLSVFQNHPQCPTFIMMSATINLEKFIKYYNLGSRLQWTDVGLLKPAAMKFPVDYFYFSKSDTLLGRLDEAMQHVDKYYQEHNILNQQFKDILIFTKGGKIMKDVIAFLQTKKYSFPFEAFEYGSADVVARNENYLKFKDPMPGKIKIIVSTNLLEAGASIQGLYTAIDSGIRLSPIYNNIQRQLDIVSLPISKSSLDQRMGRVGRIGPGMFIGLYDRSRVFMAEDMNPLLIKPNIFQIIFIYLSYQIQEMKTIQDFLDAKIKVDVQAIDLIEHLSSDVVIKSYHQLLRFGLIKRNGEITIMFYMLLKKGYTSFIKYVCQFYGCSPFEQCLIQYIVDRTMKTSPKKRLTNQQIFEAMISQDYVDLSMDEVLMFYIFCYETLSEWQEYPEIKYDPEGYQKAFQVLNM